MIQAERNEMQKKSPPDMQAPVWNDELSVGIRELDKQHRKLFETIKRLQQNPAISIHSEAVSEIFQELMDYVSTHFASEERFMAQMGYPGLEQHRAAHIEFTERLSDMMLDAMEQTRDGTAEELFDLMQQWLESHIRNDDMHYAAFFKQQAVSAK